MDALAQVIEGREMLAPMLVDRLQKNHPHEGRELIVANQFNLDVENLIGRRNDALKQVLIRDGRTGLDLGLQRHHHLPLFAQHPLQPAEIPLLFKAADGNMGANHITHRTAAQVGDLFRQALRLEDFIALLVDHLALIVGHIVVLKQLLAHVEVARLHLALRAFDAAGDHLGLDGLAVGHLQALHDGAYAITRKDSHQGIVEGQIKARRPRVALAPRAASQLVVDASGLMAFGGNDAKTAFSLDLVMQRLPLVAQLL